MEGGEEPFPAKRGGEEDVKPIGGRGVWGSFGEAISAVAAVLVGVVEPSGQAMTAEPVLLLL